MSADIFVYLDTVQFSKNGLQNRNQIKSRQGALWLTLPVRHEFGQTIKETQIADPRSTTKHWKTVAGNYSHSPGFKRWDQELHELLHSGATSLAEIAIASTEWMLEKLDVKTKRIRASELAECEGQASKLVASLCAELHADTYLTGTGALAYLDQADFSCDVSVQQWQPFVYSQQWDGFVPDLSTLDLLLNCPDDAAHLIESAGSWKTLA